MVNIIPDIKVGNIGTVFKATITQINPTIPKDEITGDPDQRQPVDLTTATDTKIEIESPRGKRYLLPATIIAPATDGKIRATDQTGIFDREGRWKVRGIVTFDTGNFFQGTWTGFMVGE